MIGKVFSLSISKIKLEKKML